MKFNINGLKIIAKFEGCSLKGYVCPAGVLTIGYGSTGLDYFNLDKRGNPTPISLKTVWTKEQCKQRLMKDIADFSNKLIPLIGVDLTSNQFSALVSLVYNIGLGAFKKSTLLKKINQGDFKGAADEFPKWNKAGGKVLPGLTNRRAAERFLFLI
jgi:lysozyme